MLLGSFVIASGASLGSKAVLYRRLITTINGLHMVFFT
jgi:hypothetical protein